MSSENTVLQAPKLTQADINAVILSEQYFTAEHGINGALVRGELHGNVKSSEWVGGLAHITFCVLTLRNGAKVTGVNHGPVSAANFYPLLGRAMARENAIDKVWELEGYLLRDRLASAPKQATDGGPNPHYDQDADKGAKLLEIVRAWVDMHQIDKPAMSRPDGYVGNAYVLLRRLVEVAGYYVDPAEGEEAQP